MTCFNMAMTVPSEDQARTMLRQMSRTAEAWIERVGTADGFPVGVGSPLQGDDSASQPFLVSHALLTCIGAAVDHLHGLYALVLDTGYLHLYTPASVTRGALETAAAAIWIASPVQRDERIRRALRWAYKDVRDGDTAATGAGIPVPTPLQDRLDKLNKVAAARGLPDKVKGYTSTEAVEAAKAHLGPAKMDILLLWRLCSGFAHGRAWPVLGFAESVQSPITGHPDRVGVKSENSYDRVLAMALTADQAIRSAIDLYELRARAR